MRNLEDIIEYLKSMNIGEETLIRKEDEGYLILEHRSKEGTLRLVKRTETVTHTVTP